MIDPLAMESLEHVDALYLGLIFPSTLTPGTWHRWEERVAFAKQLNYGPWAQVVRRREAARRERVFQLESQWMWDYIWPPDNPDAIRQQEYRTQRLRELRGYL